MIKLSLNVNSVFLGLQLGRNVLSAAVSKVKSQMTTTFSSPWERLSTISARAQCGRGKAGCGSGHCDQRPYSCQYDVVSVCLLSE